MWDFIFKQVTTTNKNSPTVGRHRKLSTTLWRPPARVNAWLRIRSQLLMVVGNSWCPLEPSRSAKPDFHLKHRAYIINTVDHQQPGKRKNSFVFLISFKAQLNILFSLLHTPLLLAPLFFVFFDKPVVKWSQALPRWQQWSNPLWASKPLFKE